MKTAQFILLAFALQGCGSMPPPEENQAVLEQFMSEYATSQPLTERKKLENIVALSSGSHWDLGWPIVLVEGRVQAVSGEFALIDRGHADGLVEGNEITIYRPSMCAAQFVAKVTVVRLGIGRSSARIAIKGSDPRKGDRHHKLHLS